MTRPPIGALALALALGAAAAAATAGAGPLELLSSPATSWSLGAVFRSIDLDLGDSTASVRQLAAPLHFAVPVGERGEMVVAAGAGRSTLEIGGEGELSGAADTKLKGIARFLDDRFQLSLGVGLPTGRRELTTEEASVARFISQTLLGFRAKNLGEGLDFDLGVAAAKSLGPTRSLAFGAGYLHKGAYTLFEADSTDYEPGGEVTLTAGLDVTGERIFWRADATFRAFGTDRQGGQDIFEQGNRLELEQLATAAWRRTTVSLGLRESIAGENQLFDPGAEGAGAAAINTNGPSDFRAELTVTRALALGRAAGARLEPRRLAVDGTLTYARFGASELELGDGYLAGFGGGVELPVLGSAALRLSAEVLTGTGRVGETGAEADVSGYELAVGLLRRGEGAR